MPSRPQPPAEQDLDLHSIISSTRYTNPPSLEQLESIKASLVGRRRETNARLVSLDPSEEARLKKEKKERKRKEKERELALANANASSSAAAAASAAAEAEEKAEEERGRERIAAIEAATNARLEAALSASAGRAGSSGVKVKRERETVSPAPSNASMTSARPHAAPVTYSHNKKKKQKRIQDSDDEAQARATPTSPPSHTTTSGLKVRLPQSSSGPHAKSRPSSTISGTDEQNPGLSAAASISGASGSNIDFSLPTPVSRPLIPLRPGIQPPPKPGPKKQSEVDEDYSNVKAPNQIGLPAFWNSVEPYLRDIREDDIAMLGFKADAPESFEIPPKGRHYTEVWDEEDGAPPGTTPRVSVPNLRQMTTGAVPTPGAMPPSWTPAEMSDHALIEELRGLGHISERLVAAVIPEAEAELAAYRERTKGTVGEEYEREAVKVNARELEERLKKELRGVLLLGEHDEFDASKREDDEITSSLRQCQRLLAAQVTLNEQRKLRLAERAKWRVANTEYQTALEGIEKSIESHWAKRVKKHGLKKSTSSSSGSGSGRPPVPENLKALVETRKRWMGTAGKWLKERPIGEVKGLPDRSVYEGIGDEWGAGQGAGHGDGEDREGRGVREEDERDEEEVLATLGGGAGSGGSAMDVEVGA